MPTSGIRVRVVFSKIWCSLNAKSSASDGRLVEMGLSKIDIENFDGKGDFSMWKKKMRAVLIQQKCAKAISDPSKFPEVMKSSKKHEIMENPYSLLILNLVDNVLRQVDEEETALKVWTKLESLYMVKSLSGKIYLKE